MIATKLQIPIDKKVRDGLERRARSLGFDSAQAYIRVWAKAEAEGRKLDFDSKVIVLSPEANARYEQLIAEIDESKKTGNLQAFTSAKDFMKDL